MPSITHARVWSRSLPPPPLFNFFKIKEITCHVRVVLRKTVTFSNQHPRIKCSQI